MGGDGEIPCLRLRAQQKSTCTGFTFLALDSSIYGIILPPYIPVWAKYHLMNVIKRSIDYNYHVRVGSKRNITA